MAHAAAKMDLTAKPPGCDLLVHVLHWQAAVLRHLRSHEANRKSRRSEEDRKWALLGRWGGSLGRHATTPFAQVDATQTHRTMRHRLCCCFDLESEGKLCARAGETMAFAVDSR